jgi:hypothetical protein
VHGDQVLLLAQDAGARAAELLVRVRVQVQVGVGFGFGFGFGFGLAAELLHVAAHAEHQPQMHAQRTDVPASGLGRRSLVSGRPLEGWRVAAMGLGPLPRRRGSALAHGCDRSGRVVLPLARAAGLRAPIMRYRGEIGEI